MISKERRQEKYSSYKENHICPQCKSEWYGPQVMCDKCREHQEDLRRKRKEERLSKGLCTVCGKHQVIPNTKYCKECFYKSRKHKDSDETKRKRLIRYHTVYKDKLIERRLIYKSQGLCADCGQTEPKFGVVCESCYNKRQKVYFKSKIKAPEDCCGDCLKCKLPWCVDVDDEVEIKLTKEEIRRAEEFDRETLRDKDVDKREIRLAKMRLRNNQERLKYLYSLKKKPDDYKVKVQAVKDRIQRDKEFLKERC